MRKETELIRLKNYSPEQLARHAAYVKRRNRAFWAWFREDAIDDIADRRECTYSEATRIYNGQWRVLRELRG